MWLMLSDGDGPENLFIPEDMRSSTGEYDSMRSELAYYWMAVDEFLATGNSDDLEPFAGAYIVITDSDGNDQIHYLETDPDELEEYAADWDYEDPDSGGGANVGL